MTKSTAAMRTKGAVVGLVALGFCGGAPAQEPQQVVRRVMTEPAPDVRWPEGQASVRVPFESLGGHVVLPVSVNGSAPLPLVLDTGLPAGGVVLYETEAVNKIPLEMGEMRARVAGAGGTGQAIEAKVAEDVTLKLGNLELAGNRAIVMPPLRHFASTHAGVIGAALFRSFTVRIDQDAGVVELFRPGRFSPPEGARSLPLEVRGPVPFVAAEVTMAAGQAAVPVKLAVDTGATHAVSLNASSDERLALPAGAVATRIGRGVSGPLEGHVGRVAALSLGGLTLKDVVSTFPAKQFENPRLDSRNGNLGIGALRRFNVTFDYAGGRMLLEPARGFRDAFEWDMSGLVLEPGDGGALTVESVLPGSPAAQAGLKAGDRIEKIAGEAVSGADVIRLGEWFRLSGHKGRSVALTFRRADEVREVTIELRRLV